MNRATVALALILLAPELGASVASAQTASEGTLRSGVNARYIDANVRPQDDFYGYVNGKWLQTTDIPGDKGKYGTFDKLTDDTLDQLRGVVDEIRASTSAAGPDERNIAELYAGFMDEATLERRGLHPLDAEFARVASLKSKSRISSLIAHLNRIGVSAPFTPEVHQDARDSTKYVFDLHQDGLGMPDRDYYLQDDARLGQIRVQYARHVENMLTMAGDRTAAADARAIVALETAMATAQWTKVENRDPIKTYNKVEFDRLPALAPGLDWKTYLSDSGVLGKTGYLVIRQPGYVAELDRIVRDTPLPVWRAYFRWRVLSEFAPYLGKRYVDEHFAFYGTALRGIQENKPRWKRGIELLDDLVGEDLGRIYVRRYFPPESKARMDRLVRNLLAAYRADIETLDWMGPETKLRAQEKLAKFTVKIGYPDRWRDYSALKIVPGDLVGNIIRGEEFEYDRNLAKLGKPVDRGEWEMTPQTINAYYNPERNEIVFPAAILQPPFFDAKADDAVNYGGIGAVIGHEISHGFDDQGSQYDGSGNLLDSPGWFTQADLDRFKARTRALIAQYAAYAPVPGFFVNGELTLGENIADNSGLSIAYKAYRLSLDGKESPVIDGLTGDQRYFMGWAQVWRAKTRDSEAIVRIKADPHSPPQFRAIVPVMNQAAFHAAFGVKDGDKMYLAPENRVSLW